LKTISLSYSPLSAPHPGVWIRIEFGDPIPSKEPGQKYQLSSVEIMIPKDGQAAFGRLIFRAEDGGSSSFEKF